jgi:CubicO group peptidase (beta-lactamase class C family)
MNKSFLSLFLILLTTGQTVAQLQTLSDPATAGFITQRLARIDSAISAEVTAGRIPGAVALVARNGKIVYHKSFGFADIDTKTPMQANSIFRIASMTKAVTTVAVMMLYEQGHFQLKDPLARYIPAFAKMKVIATVEEDGSLTTTDATKPITIIDLLTHTSGISYPFIPGNLQKTYVDAGVIDGLTVENLTLQSQMELLASQPLLFEPGSEWAYGLSSDVLGYLIEVISGKPLDRFFTEEIFTPLGMTDTYFYLPDDKAEQLVTLYAALADGSLIVSKGGESSIKLENTRYPIDGARSYFSGGAGLSSTALDYARFCQMLLNNGSFNGNRLLSRKSIELIRTSRADIDQDGRNDFGLGFYVNDLAETGELGSTGAYTWGGAFNTGFWVDPEENLVGVIMGQARPTHSSIRNRFRILVYQALE